jgi:hypothetical protein
MYTLIFFALAAICNSVMDTLKDHFYVSVFRNLNLKFWNPSISWKNIMFNYVSLDAWHIAKGCMLGCIYFSIFFYKNIFGMWDLLIFPIVWGIFFQLFYSILLIKK